MPGLYEFLLDVRDMWVIWSENDGTADGSDDDADAGALQSVRRPGAEWEFGGMFRVRGEEDGGEGENVDSKNYAGDAGG